MQRRIISIVCAAVVIGLSLSAIIVKKDTAFHLRGEVLELSLCGDGVWQPDNGEECDGTNSGICTTAQFCSECLCHSLQQTETVELTDDLESPQFIDSARLVTEPLPVLIGQRIFIVPEREDPLPLLSTGLQTESETIFWVYEYTGNEWKTASFDGLLYASPAFLDSLDESDRETWEERMLTGEPLRTFESEKTYYIWSADPLTLDLQTGLMLIEACGDGIVVDGEECDDGNTDGDDGCTECKVDTGFTCVDEPSECSEAIENKEDSVE